MRFSTTLVIAIAAAATGLSSTQAQNTVYWDINGADPGAGNVGGFTDGVWGTESFWSPDPNGEAATGAWVAGDHAVFSAGNDAVDSFIDITDTQVAGSVLIEEGIVFLASGELDTSGDITVESGATLRINTSLRLAGTAGKVVLNGGTLMQTNPGQAGSFLNATKTLEINGTGIISYTSLNDDNSPGAGTVSIYSGMVTGTGGTTTNGGAGTLIKRGLHRIGMSGANQANYTFAKLVIEEGMYQARHVDGVILDTVYGAEPLVETLDAVTIDGGEIGANASFATHANRGFTIGPNGGAFVGDGFGTITINGLFSGAGDFTMHTGGGGIILTNPNNTFSGKFIIQGTTLGAISDSALGTAPDAVVADQIILGGPSPTTTVGTLRLDTTTTLNSNRGITLEASGGQISALQLATVTYNGVIAGSGNLTKTGLGTWILSGNNTYTGTTTSFGGGVLSISSDQNLGIAPDAPTANNITLAGATTGGTLSASATMTLNANRGITLNLGQPTGDPVPPSIGGTLDVVDGATLTVPGVVTGDGKLTKTGAGTLALTNANTNTGLVSVNGGALLANNTSGSGTGSGAVAVNTDGTLGGTGSIEGLITVNTGGILAPGAGIGTLTAAGGLTVEAGSILSFEIDAPGTSDLIDVTLAGGLALNGGSVSLSDAGGLAEGTYTLIGYAGTLGGSLANLGTPTGPAGFNYSLVDTGSTIDLSVSPGTALLTGDYNNDGTVDAADYTVWRDNVGAETLPFNRDPDIVGVVGDEDYDAWVANFGMTGGAGVGGSAAVPEPASLALAALALAGLIGLARRTK